MIARRAALSALLLAALPALAWGHAQLRSAQPPVGGTVQAPASVELTFTEGVEPRFSTITVTDAAGNAVDRKDVHTPGSDARHLAIGLKPLGPGEYRVEWHATSVDTHKTEGSFTFRVTP